MKKLLSLLFVAVCGLSLGATEIVFDSNPNGGTKGTSTNAGQADEMELSGVKIATTGGAFACTSSDGSRGYYAYRFGKNKEITISSSSTITKVEFICVTEKVSGNDYSASGFKDGVTISEDNSSAVWTGSATEVKLTPTEHQVRAEKVIVTIEGEATTISAPKFNPAGGTFYGTQSVEITASEGATIYYTLDGTNPTTASAVYSNALEIAKTTTVKAIAVKGNLTSEVATAEYVISELNAVANIAAYKALADGTAAAINNKLNVYYVSGSNVYVKDETGYLCLYTKSNNAAVKAYKAGDVIPAGIGGVKATYRDYIIEMADDFFNVQAATEKATVEPEVVDASFVTVENTLAYIKIENVNVTAQATANYFTLTDSKGGTATIYGTKVTEGDFDYVIAMITVYNGAPQLTVIEQYKAVAPTEIENLAALPDKADGVTYIVKNPVTVVAQSGSQLYVTDESASMLVYGKLEKEYKNGDVLTDISGTIKVFNGLVELVPVVETFGDAAEGPAVEPEVLPIEEVDQSMVHKYVKLENVTIAGPTDEKARTFTLTDETYSIQMYLNGFGVTAPETLEGKTFDVTGFVALYTKNNATTIQIYPTEIKDLSEQEEGLAGDLNGDNSVNTGDVSVLYDVILGNVDDQTVVGKANVNGDDSVNTGDVSNLYEIILGTGTGTN